MVSLYVGYYHELVLISLRSLAVLCAGDTFERYVHGSSNRNADLGYAWCQLEYGTLVYLPFIPSPFRTFALQKPCYSPPLRW